MNLSKLISEFSAIHHLPDGLQEYISGRTDSGEVFPPYIPFVGEKYEKNKNKILIYATSQNIEFNSYFRQEYSNNKEKLVERLYFNRAFSRKYPDEKVSYRDLAIYPYQSGVLIALFAVFLFSTYALTFSNSELHDLVAISNYYKFSLGKGKKDYHPEYYFTPAKLPAILEYWALNDKLVKQELEVLQPKVILSFKGRRRVRKLQEFVGNDTRIIEINDPSWILRGGSGVFSYNGSWNQRAKSIKDKKPIEYVHSLLELVKDSRYQPKQDQVKIYLLNYYLNWAKSQGAGLPT